MLRYVTSPQYYSTYLGHIFVFSVYIYSVQSKKQETGLSKLLTGGVCLVLSHELTYTRVNLS